MSNFMFKDNLTENVNEDVILDSKPMTAQGSVSKTLFLLAIVILCGLYTWNMGAQGFTDRLYIITAGSAIFGFILAIFTSFNPKASMFTGILYAVCEGFFLGAVSCVFDSAYNGIVVQAVGATLTTALSMLILYKLNIFRATEKFKKIVLTATMGIGIYYLIAIIAGFLGHAIIPLGSLIGIGISAFVCGVAAFNLIIDFDFIERGSQNMLPDYYEWYGAFGLLVTLVWLYVELLRLFAQLNSRR